EGPDGFEAALAVWYAALARQLPRRECCRLLGPVADDAPLPAHRCLRGQWHVHDARVAGRAVAGRVVRADAEGEGGPRGAGQVRPAGERGAQVSVLLEGAEEHRAAGLR